jgi:hypothetical protein
MGPVCGKRTGEWGLRLASLVCAGSEREWVTAFGFGHPILPVAFGDRGPSFP